VDGHKLDFAIMMAITGVCFIICATAATQMDHFTKKRLLEHNEVNERAYNKKEMYVLE
jgi:hypothetical protein